MNTSPFRVLYRQFLFRIVDLELISAHGDTSKVLGQFAAILVFVSLSFSLGALLFDGGQLSGTALQARGWGIEHMLIATTILVVGIFSVVSWDSIFPNQQDVLVLVPLPIRPQTLSLAKLAAVATALGLAVLALNGLSGLAWPLALATGGIGGGLKLLIAYWITIAATSTFVFCSVLSVLGWAAQLLARRTFLRFSAILQIAAFCLFLSMFFLEPPLAAPKALSDPQNQSLLAWLPSYWFLGLLQKLNGSAETAIASLARRALLGLLISGLSAAAAFLLSYLRSLHRIAEEPDITPRARRSRWAPLFGNGLRTAVLLFSIRTLLRSRRHRALLCFYLGIGFTIMTLTGRDLHRSWHQVNVGFLVSSAIMLFAATVGTRVAFAMPLELRANWIFRIIPLTPPAILEATRRALWILTIAPVLLASAAFFLTIWPWFPAAGHAMALGLLGATCIEISLRGFRKIPFTCSYLPGKGNLFFAAWIFVLALPALVWCAMRELRILQSAAETAALLTVLALVALAARWLNMAMVKSSGQELNFEEEAAPVILSLGLHRDGVLPVRNQH